MAEPLAVKDPAVAEEGLSSNGSASGSTSSSEPLAGTAER